MTHAPFTKATRRAALERSGGRCEAVGAWYGLEPGQRCDVPLGRGVEFDHVDQDANSRDNSLENAAAVCPRCHAFKTRHIDIPKAAKTVRQRDKHIGIRGPRRAWPKRPMRQEGADNTKRLEET